jgi:hypothetical protein
MIQGAANLWQRKPAMKVWVPQRPNAAASDFPIQGACHQASQNEENVDR